MRLSLSRRKSLKALLTVWGARNNSPAAKDFLASLRGEASDAELNENEFNFLALDIALAEKNTGEIVSIAKDLLKDKKNDKPV